MKIDEAVLDQVVKDGYKSVLNVRRASEANLEKEEELCKAKGLAYANVPIEASADGIDASAVRQAADALHALPHPAFVHCAGGGRASAVVLAHNAIHLHNPATLTQMLEAAASAGYIYNPSWHKSLQAEFFP